MLSFWWMADWAKFNITWVRKILWALHPHPNGKQKAFAIVLGTKKCIATEAPCELPGILQRWDRFKSQIHVHRVWWDEEQHLSSWEIHSHLAGERRIQTYHVHCTRSFHFGMRNSWISAIIMALLTGLSLSGCYKSIDCSCLSLLEMYICLFVHGKHYGIPPGQQASHSVERMEKTDTNSRSREGCNLPDNQWAHRSTRGSSIHEPGRFLKRDFVYFYQNNLHWSILQRCNSKRRDRRFRKQKM